MSKIVLNSFVLISDIELLRRVTGNLEGTYYCWLYFRGRAARASTNFARVLSQLEPIKKRFSSKFDPVLGA